MKLDEFQKSVACAHVARLFDLDNHDQRHDCIAVMELIVVDADVFDISNETLCLDPDAVEEKGFVTNETLNKIRWNSVIMPWVVTS